MATESGIVTKINPNDHTTAWVKIIPSNACESCSSRHSCTVKSGGDEREVEALNLVGASVDDRIQVMISTRSLLKATFLLYIFPILCMLTGGIVGHVIAVHLQWDTSLLAAIAAFICLGTAIPVVRRCGNRMAQNKTYRPRIIRIVDRHIDSPDKPNHPKPAIPVT